MILTLARAMEVPLREQNRLLLAAGYAPRYSETAVDGPEGGAVREAIDRILVAHDPYPGLVVDRHFDLVTANEAAMVLVSDVAPELLAGPINLYRLSLHPDGMGRRTTNFGEWAPHLVRQLLDAARRASSPTLDELVAEVRSYPNVAALDLEPLRFAAPALTLNVEYDAPVGHLSMFTTLTTFGSPLDVTVDELLIELFYPADDDSARRLRGERPPSP